MAQLYIGLNRGQHGSTGLKEITTGAATGSTDVELRIDDTKSLTKGEVEELVGKILDYLNFAKVAIPEV